MKMEINTLLRILMYILLLMRAPTFAAGMAYYVDFDLGNDGNNGLSTSSPWKTLSKVNSTTFSPGSKVLLKAGCSWTGELYPKGFGTSSNPNVIDMYGFGARPIIAASGAVSGVYLLNQPYWEINNLEITNKTSLWGDYHGISINGKDFGTIDHTYIRKCYIHDVHGVVAWIGNSNSNGAAGIIDAAGWDGAKHSGGIVFDVTTATSVKTKFNDIIIEDNVISDCSFGGICIKQWQGSVGWGGRTSASDPKWYPHTNLVIRNNYLSQYNNDHGCNTIFVSNIQNGLIENNVSAHSGVSAIELYYTDKVRIQYNETFGTIQRCNGADFNGIDPDKGTTGAIIQYNYVHDNGDGILLCQLAFGDAIVRYNILQNNSRNSLNLHSDSRATAQIYNNTFYSNRVSGSLVNSSGGASTLDKGTYVLSNNIFYAAAKGPTVVAGAKTTYNYNLYYGVSVAPGDTHSKTANPLLVNPGSGGTGTTSGWAVGSLSGYKLQASSPCIGAGVAVSGSGGMDFWGGALYNANADIGANEFDAPVGVENPIRLQANASPRRNRSGLTYSMNGRLTGYLYHEEALSRLQNRAANSVCAVRSNDSDSPTEIELFLR